MASNKIKTKKLGGYSALTIAVSAVAALLLSGCHGGGDDVSNGNGNTTSSAPSGNGNGGGTVTPGGNGTGSGTVTIGGTVSGVTGSEFSLQDNGADNLAVASSATTFTFATPLITGSSYSVSVFQYPDGQTCSLSNEAGTAGTNITSVSLSCSPWTAATAFTSVLAGSSTSGSADGIGSTATFDHPWGMAADASGNVYVADEDNNLIRKITPAGVVTTFAGSGSVGSSDGTGTAASFSAPTGLAVDGSGNVYVADRNNDEIRKITPAGVVTTLAGNTTSGFTNATGTAAAFNQPFAVALDSSGNVYVADQQNNAIRKVTPTGVVTTLAGSGTAGFTDATGTAAQFHFPSGVAVDGSGNVYVTDQINNCIRKVTQAGAVTTFAGNGTGAGVDGTGTAAEFFFPQGIAIDADGDLYVADDGDPRVRMVSPTAVVSTLAGNGSSGTTDGTGTTAEFMFPAGIALSLGNVVVTDQGTNAIRIIKRNP